ncbi:MAG: hypothetical protein US98_C0057G0010 [Parcubacteria group bacterium GW2011_GWC1_38_6]|nr:MAG: hypothetical protein US98_C0057G0010 [Parcubacteria group bacterium GW2011_GWC1_38_6]
MINQQILDYIKEQLQSGKTKDDIKNSLSTGGWLPSDVEEAFNMLNSQVQPQLTPPDNMSSVRPRKPKKALFAIISIIIGITIIGGGIFAYLNYSQSPESILQKMSSKLIEIKSFEYSGEITAQINTDALDTYAGTKDSSSNKVNFSINFNGSSDIQDLDNPKDQLALNIKADALPIGDSFFEIETRTIDKIIYIKINNLPDLGIFDLSAVENQWIKIDTENIKKQLGLEKFEEQIKEKQKEQELTPEQIEELKTVLQQAKIFKATEKLPNEKVDGINTYHYKIEIDKEGLKKIFAEISDIAKDKFLSDAEFEKIIESLGFHDGEIWIGKKDLLPYKFSSSLTIKETETSKTSGEFNVILLFKNFNKPISIEIPKPNKSLEEILGELFAGLKGFLPTPVPENVEK